MRRNVQLRCTRDMRLLFMRRVVRDFEVEILELPRANASAEVHSAGDVGEDADALARDGDADDRDVKPDLEEIPVEGLLFEDLEDRGQSDAARDLNFAVRFELDRRGRLEPRRDAQAERPLTV